MLANSWGQHDQSQGGFEVSLCGWTSRGTFPLEVIQRVQRGEILLYRSRGVVYEIKGCQGTVLANPVMGTSNAYEEFTKTAVARDLEDAIRWALEAPEEFK